MNKHANNFFKDAIENVKIEFVYRLFLPIKFLGKNSKDELDRFFEIYKKNWGGHVSVKRLKVIEKKTIDRELTVAERQEAMGILSRPIAVNDFVKQEIENQREPISLSKNFSCLACDDAKKLLQHLLSIRTDDANALHTLKWMLKRSLTIEMIPETYLSMTTEELRHEINNWDIDFFGQKSE